ncbi:MAG: hypothetical protein ACPGJS_01415 [Flammeovirgaceae bacterium]
MLEQLPAYIAKQIELALGLPCEEKLITVEEEISSDTLALYVNGEFISAFELFDEESVEEIAVELLDGQMAEIEEVLMTST